jgi:hypothetical protein
MLLSSATGPRRLRVRCSSGLLRPLRLAVGSERAPPSVSQVSTSAMSAPAAMPATIGSGRPSVKKPTTAMASAPVSICSVPSSAEAVPAMAPCISSASTPVVGITRPMKPEAMKYRTISTQMLSPPAAK